MQLPNSPISPSPISPSPIATGPRDPRTVANDLFDADTEQGFEYRDLERHFVEAGYRKVDEVFPGLLAYVLYYNPDAFPALNVGGTGLVRATFGLDRLFWTNAIGRKLSFATIGLWQRG